MVRYKVKYWDCIDKETKTVKGWAQGSSFSEGAKVIEEYYGDSLNSVEIALYDNFDLNLVEDTFFQSFAQEDIE